MENEDRLLPGRPWRLGDRAGQPALKVTELPIMLAYGRLARPCAQPSPRTVARDMSISFPDQLCASFPDQLGAAGLGGVRNEAIPPSAVQTEPLTKLASSEPRKA
ncbi:MAG TPA: hypothetical protein VJ305_03745, partial [Streptosporangiaceae bacterium]|nr:hypothetical protein [Streptosporangiaceae bacterium]